MAARPDLSTADAGPSAERARLLALAAALRPGVDPARLRCTPLARTRNSRVYEVSDGGALRWAAKVCVDPWTRAPSPEAARIQFDALCALRDRARDARAPFGRPDPVHLDEAASLVVMSWVEGESLTADLRRFPRAAATLERHVEEAGRWLALLHSAGPGSAGALPAERKLAGLNDALRLETARDGAFVRAVALLERYAADAAAAPHPWSWIHGDFKPDNILFGDGGAAGIDAQLRNVTSVLEDVAPFLNSLELQCALPRAWRARARRAALGARFLAGYTKVMGPLPLLPLAWARLYSASALWAYDMTIARSPVKALVAYRLHRRLVERLSAELATTRPAAGTG